MRKLKDLFSSQWTFKRIDYECGRLVILAVDASLIEIGWAIGQDGVNRNRYEVWC